MCRHPTSPERLMWGVALAIGAAACGPPPLDLDVIAPDGGPGGSGASVETAADVSGHPADSPTSGGSDAGDGAALDGGQSPSDVAALADTADVALGSEDSGTSDVGLSDSGPSDGGSLLDSQADTSTDGGRSDALVVTDAGTPDATAVDAGSGVDAVWADAEVAGGLDAGGPQDSTSPVDTAGADGGFDASGPSAPELPALRLGGPEKDLFRAVAVTASGWAAAGATWSWGAGGSDVLLAAFDSDGTPVWSSAFGGPEDDEATAIAATPDGGLIAAGRTASFHGYYDVYLMRTAPDGELLWARSYGGDGWDGASAVAALADGSFVVVAETWNYGPGTPYHHNMWVFGVDADGEITWSHVFGEKIEGDAGFRIIEVHDSAGAPDGLLLAGATESWGMGHDDVWLLRLTSDGDVLWSRAYGAEEDDEARDVIQTADGGFAVTGFTRGFGVYYSEAILLKVDAGGELEWMRTIGGKDDDEGVSIVELPSGYAISGTTESFGGGAHDVFVVTTDELGGVATLRSWGGIGDERGAGMVTNGVELCIAGSVPSPDGDEEGLLLRLWPDGGAGCRGVDVPLDDVKQGSPTPIVTPFEPIGVPGGLGYPTDTVETVLLLDGLTGDPCAE